MSKGKTMKKKKDKKSAGQVLKLGLQLFLLVLLLAIATGILYFYLNYGKTILQMQSQAKQLVKASTEETFRASQTSLVYDSEGDIISTLKAEKDVYYLEYEDIPLMAVEAMVVTEDRKFLAHDGVDYLANVRAAIELIEHKGEITQGASTITQQLARNIFLSNEVTYNRKIEEIFIAQELEKKYAKTDILEFYLNNIYFSNGYYGIQAAGNGYFGESVTNLSLSQIIFLCAIPNNPNLYNPVTHMDNTLKRRDRILEQLLEEEKIDAQEYHKALNETIELKQQKKDKKNYVETYIYHCAIEALMKRQGFEFRNQFDSKEDQQSYEEAYDELYYSCQQDLFVSGYRIYTSIDMKKQEQLQKSVDSALKGFKEKNKDGIYQLQAAAVTIDNDNGRVVAIVGGRSQKLEGYTFNRGYQSRRQPGSAIKPLIVYTPMFERGYTPENDVVDEPIEDGPKNSDKSYAGEMKLQRAIELSKNTIAWKLFQELTPPVGLSYLLHMNFSDIRDEDYNMAVSLGGFTTGVSPVEMAAGYSALENDGYYREPTCIVKIMDSQGNEIIGDMIESKPVYQTNAARIMTEALTGVMKNGTAKGLGLTNTVCAGKTGTTNDRKDGWFVGYTPYYTTSVWVGYDLPKSMGDLSGASYPGTIWHDFMEKIHNSSMDAPFTLYDWRALLEQKEEQSEDQPEDGNEAMENTDEEEDSDAELTPEGTGEEEDIEEIQEEESDSEEINEDITEEITDEINDEIKEEEDMETIPDDIPSDEMEETEEMPEEIGDRSESEVTEELDLDNSLEENEDTEEAEITTVP